VAYTPIQLAPAFLPLRGGVTLLLLLLLVTLPLPVRYPVLLWITLVLAAISVPASYLLEQRGLLRDHRFRWILPGADMALVTLLHVGTCGAVSPFFPLFYLPIAYAGLLGGYVAALVTALAASAIYGLLYMIGPTRPEVWVAIIAALLFPLAGAISGYLGRYLAQLNRRGQSFLEQAQRMHREVEDRRALYERWYRAVDRLKADFVYSASHELRTPLTPVKGYLQMLLSPGLALPADKVREVMGIMSKNVDILAQLVDDILYLQRVTRIPIDLEEVTLSTVAKQAVEEVSGEMEEAKVQIHLEEDPNLPPVLGSGDSLKLILGNILETAIRDSPEGGEVELALCATVEGVEIRISGSGRGIPTEQQERIFDLFFHADSSPTYVLGREGLSLAISRYIAEMHGGRITVESQPRGGIVFTVYLPGRT
jgi:signal transduction histidine kinase